SMSNPQLQSALNHLSRDREQAVARLSQFLSIPSVSTDAAYQPHIEQAAQWVAQQLAECGLDAQILPTQGHPAVLATSPAHAAPADAPTVLFYGHYDVQPPDPVDQWRTPPFEPAIRDGAIYARGASDDKGQVCCF